MKKLLTFILLTFFSILTADAAQSIIDGGKYQFVSTLYPNGCVTIGSDYSQQTPVYYLPTATKAEDTYWILKKVSDGVYTIQNAKSLQYITYDGVRIESYKRYVDLTSTDTGANSHWSISSLGDGSYQIRNVGATAHVWDVRANSMIVGTYSNTGSAASNQIFKIYDENGNMLKEPIPTVTSPLDECLDNLMFEGRGMPYDTKYQRYLYTIGESEMRSTVYLTVDYEKKEGWGDLYINNVKIESGSTAEFAVTPNKTFALKCSTIDGSKSITSKVVMTSLPVVDVYGSFGYDYADGLIRVFEYGELQPKLFNTRMAWRGGITNGSDKHKRNYNIKLYKEDGTKKNKQYFGLRDDNRWILDAGQVDMSRVRNRVLTELWLDYSHKPYYYDLEPKSLTGCRAAMCEMLLNGEYRGVYFMGERMDRKQMKLVDYDEISAIQHGQLWKGKDWGYAVFMGHYSNNTNYPKTKPSTPSSSSEYWDGYTVEYPDIDDVNPTDWSTLYNAVELIASKSDAEITQNFLYYFDYPVLLDYYILMELTLSTDNHGKNMYYGVYDKQNSNKITFGVWDLDATLGQRWSDAYYHSTLMKPEQDYTTYIVNNEHGDWNLFRMMRLLNIHNFNEEVRYRYRELRQTCLNTDSLCYRFENAIQRMKNSGAATREVTRWSGDTDINKLTLNFDTELTYIKDWLTRRLNYLDNTRFKISELPSAVPGVESVDDSEPFSVNLFGHNIVITCDKSQSVNIYSIGGSLVRTEKLQPGVNEISNLPSGVYIVGKKKVVLK